MKDEVEEGHKTLQKKIDDNLKKANDYTNEEVLKMSK